LVLIYFVFLLLSLVFFFQAEDGIRDRNVTGLQTCALPILLTAGDSVGGGEHGVEHRFGVRDPTGQRRRGVADARTQFEHVDPSRSEERRVGKEWRSRHVTER